MGYYGLVRYIKRERKRERSGFGMGWFLGCERKVPMVLLAALKERKNHPQFCKTKNYTSATSYFTVYSVYVAIFWLNTTQSIQ